MIRVRTANLEDLPAIQAVCVRNGLSGFDPEDRRRWWLSHPFRGEFKDMPIGWVLENEDKKIVGTFSNIPMMYEMEGRRLKCAIAASWGVDPAYRNSSLMLAMSYFSQKGVDFCLNGSASAVSSRIMPVLKAQRVPSPDYDMSYFWITEHRRFAKAMLRKKRVPLAEVLSHPVALALRLSGPRPSGGNSTIKRLLSFGREFDSLWEKLRRVGSLMRAVRTPAVLEWRFGEALRRRQAIALGLLRGNELDGYVILREKQRDHLGLRQFVIADMQALEDSSEAITSLLRAAIKATREEGLDALEWQGWRQEKRKAALQLKPKLYRYPVWPLYYKAFNLELAEKLGWEQSWDFSPFDAF